MKLSLGTALLAAIVVHAADQPALWRDPGPIETLDLAGGPGGADKAPQAPFTFVREELGGTSPKVAVKDARGAQWMVKFGQEAKAEAFASRIAWAAGYVVQATYLVREGRIEGVHNLTRAAQSVGRDGTFREGRFEPFYGPDYKPVKGSTWEFRDPVFKDSKEAAGLKVVMLLVGNWDVKPENMSIVESGGKRYYSFTDWGASMGSPDNIAARSKWNCEAFANQSNFLIDGVENGFVAFNYAGKEIVSLTSGIRVEDVRWLMQRLGKLSDDQIRAGLQASGATPEETECFTKALRKRLDLLAAVAMGEGKPGTTVTRTITTTTTTTTTAPPQ